MIYKPAVPMFQNDYTDVNASSFSPLPKRLVSAVVWRFSAAGVTKRSSAAAVIVNVALTVRLQYLLWRDEAHVASITVEINPRTNLFCCAPSKHYRIGEGAMSRLGA